MRAARFAGSGRVELLDLPAPALESGEVLVKVAYNGVCGSERAVFARGAPRVVGHEISGTVVGSNSTSIADGTRCAIYIPLHCGQCKFCRAGFENCCVNLKGMCGWNEPYNGGYGELVKVPASCILPLDDGVSFTDAVLLLDTFGTAWHAVRQGCPSDANRALVVGCGPLGLGVVAGLKAFGVPEVLACDISADRMAAAEEMGAKPVAPDDLGSIEETQIAIDVTGSTKTIMPAIRAIEPRGRMVLLGEPKDPWAFESSPRVMHRDFSFIRSWYFPKHEFFENQKLLLDGKVNADTFISHVFPLEKLEEAFSLFAEAKTRKVLIEVG